MLEIEIFLSLRSKQSESIIQHSIYLRKLDDVKHAFINRRQIRKLHDTIKTAYRKCKRPFLHNFFPPTRSGLIHASKEADSFAIIKRFQKVFLAMSKTCSTPQQSNSEKTS